MAWLSALALDVIAYCMQGRTLVCREHMVMPGMLASLRRKSLCCQQAGRNRLAHCLWAGSCRRICTWSGRRLCLKQHAVAARSTGSNKEEFHVEDTHHRAIRTKGSVY